MSERRVPAGSVQGMVSCTARSLEPWSRCPLRVRGSGIMAAKESQFCIGVEAAMPDPAAQEKVAPSKVKGLKWGRGLQERANLCLESRGEFFVGVKREHPGARTLLDGKVLLLREAGPRSFDDLSAELPGNFDCAVSRSGVDDDDLARPGDARQRASEIQLLIERNDRDREAVTVAHFAGGSIWLGYAFE